MTDIMVSIYQLLKKYEPYANVGKLCDNPLARFHLDLVKIFDGEVLRRALGETPWSRGHE